MNKRPFQDFLMIFGVLFAYIGSFFLLIGASVGLAVLLGILSIPLILVLFCGWLAALFLVATEL